MKSLVIAAGIALLATSANAAGFDCRYAHAGAEATICKDEGLSKNDDNMASLFYWMRDGIRQPWKGNFITDQRIWIYVRNACGEDTNCLYATYTYRFRQMCDQISFSRPECKDWTDENMEE